ncbi:Disease resistance RPP13-like protein 4 [Hordeum vulgare]|nr:Disease resistance RPP13-like protein 4 [Hordeum vulgare]
MTTPRIDHDVDGCIMMGPEFHGFTTKPTVLSIPSPCTDEEVLILTGSRRPRGQLHLQKLTKIKEKESGDLHMMFTKEYFIIIDDLWATSVWDVARRAFPEGTGSRIITTTEIKKIALACCSYKSKHIFEMEPLSTSHSEELFVGAVFGSGEEKSHQLDDVSKEMIRRCDGLPLAIISISSVLASQGEANTV